MQDFGKISQDLSNKTKNDTIHATRSVPLRCHLLATTNTHNNNFNYMCSLHGCFMQAMNRMGKGTAVDTCLCTNNRAVSYISVTTDYLIGGREERINIILSVCTQVRR